MRNSTDNGPKRWEVKGFGDSKVGIFRSVPFVLRRRVKVKEQRVLFVGGTLVGERGDELFGRTMLQCYATNTSDIKSIS